MTSFVKYPLYFLLTLWLVLQALLFFKYGIVTTGEGPKYIAEAKFFETHGAFSQPKYIFYSSYIFLHIISNKLGAGFFGVYILQLLLSLYALICFYKLSRYITGKQTTSIISTLLLIICLPWQTWNTHLYTESFFLSLCIIFSCYLFKPAKVKSDFIILAISFLLLLLARPTGILFIPVLMVALFYKLIKQKRKWVATGIIAAFLCTFILLLNYAMRGEGEFDFLKPFTEGHLICGVPGRLPDQPVLPANGNSIQGLLYYITHNPIQFFTLAGQRILLFFGMVRSHYSLSHNLYLAIYFYPIYLLAIAGGLAIHRINPGFNIFWITLVIVFSASVALTCDDWLNRFIMPVLPFIFLAAATGFMHMREKIIKKRLSFSDNLEKEK